MSLDLNSLSKNPSLDSRVIYQLELIGLTIGSIVIFVLAVLQASKLWISAPKPNAANVQQVQIENAIKMLQPSSN